MRSTGSTSGMRLELWIGAYALLSLVVIVLPTLVFVEQRLERALVAHELEIVAREERMLVSTLSNKVEATEGSLSRLARRVSATPSLPTAEDLAEFDRLVARDPDGAHRSRREAFDATNEAGIWIPRHAPVDDASRVFYVRAKRVIDDFTHTMDDAISENAWLLVDHGGEVVLWPRAPRFIYEASATHDYSDTDWVRLARPPRAERGGHVWRSIPSPASGWCRSSRPSRRPDASPARSVTTCPSTR